MRFALVAVIGFALGTGPSTFGEPGGVEGTCAKPSAQDECPKLIREWSTGQEVGLTGSPKPDSYVAHLERERLIYRRGWLKRGRIIRSERRRFRRSLYASPVGNHWLENAFLCIKQHEATWSSATGNGFYGGLQMDRSFQRSYGSEYASLGSANRWPRSVQIAVAIEAYLSGRGFGPWPNTRRLCGL